MFIIDKIQGNSKIGVPVFSQIGKKSNFKFQVFQEGYEEKKEKLIKNRKETQLQTYFREYNNIGSQLSQEKGKIEQRLEQIEIELQKQKNVPKRKDKGDENNMSPSDGDKFKGLKKRRAYQQNQQMIIQDQQKEDDQEAQNIVKQRLKPREPRNSSQFKSISRDHYYIVHQNMFRDDAPPPIGHYNPKYTSIQKYNRSNYVVLDERNKNEIAAKDLKQKQFIEKFQSKGLLQGQSPRSNEQDQFKIIENRLSDDSQEEVGLQFSKRKSSKNDNSPHLRSPIHEKQRLGSSPNNRLMTQESLNYRINLNQMPLEQEKRLNTASNNQDNSRNYYDSFDKNRTYEFRKNSGKLTQSIDHKHQPSMGTTSTLNSYQAPQSRQRQGVQRIGSAVTHQSFMGGGFYGFDTKNCDSSQVIISEVENTFRPIDGFSSHIKGGGIQEEFSFHDVSQRTGQTNKQNIINGNSQSGEYQLNPQQQDIMNQQSDMQTKSLINRTNLFRNSAMNPFRTYNMGHIEKAQQKQNKSTKGFDMTKNLPREFEGFSQNSRKRPSQKLTEAPRNLIYDPSFKIVEERIDIKIRQFEKVISRDRQSKSIYDAVKPATNRIQSHELNDITKCYDKLAHVRKDTAPDLKKFKDRDLDYIIKGSEAYNNIQRDNERYDYRNMFKLKRSRASRSSSMSKASSTKQQPITQKKD